MSSTPTHATEPSGTGWRRASGRADGITTEIVVDGRTVVAVAGESLALSLALASITTLRHSPAGNTPRGVFCLMGSCQECLVHVDGHPALACMEPVRAGMRVRTDQGRPA